MKLDGKAIQPRVVHTLAGAVVCVDKAQHAFSLKRGAFHGVAVVLAAYIGAAAVYLSDGLVPAAVAVFELDGLAAHGKSRELVSQTNAEHWYLSQKLFYLLNAENVLRRVAGAV